MNIITSDQAQTSELTSEYMQSWRKDTSKAISYLQSRKQISSQQNILHKLIQQNHSSLHSIFLADFGCGGGWSSHHLHKELGINNFWLFDLSRIALELAAKNLKSLPLENIHLIHEDISNPVNIPNNYFDIAISMMALCCIDNHESFLTNMLKSIKTGGSLYLSTLFNRWHPNVDLEILQKDKTRNGQYLYKVISKSSIESILDQQSDT